MSADGDTVRKMVSEAREYRPAHVANRLADALEVATARCDALTAALEVYADPRNWGIQRDQHRHPVCAWIGPGATDATPNGPGVARAALAEALAALEGGAA